MWVRLVIYFVITLIGVLLFLFVPELNIGSRGQLPLFEQMQLTGNYWEGIVRLIIEGGAIFIALAFLFGLKSK